jgi:DNA recombination protein RmuC
MTTVLIFTGGLLLGLALGWLVASRTQKVAAQTTESVLELLRTEEAKSSEREQLMLERLRSSFGELSLDSMEKTSKQLVQLNQQQLESQQKQGTKELHGAKELIDAELKRMANELEQMKKSRAQQFAELNTQLKVASERSQALELQAKALSETLGSNQARGAWGERMAEDILRNAGFKEGINYRKQQSQDGTRPDFTFILPQDLILNMDVKFPYKQFVQVVESQDDDQRERHAKAFMGDVKARIKEVSGKAYINPEAKTVNYVLLFIPNDQIYAFLHERDRSLLDDAMNQRIVLCSPGTLFAVLAVIRQAMDSFRLQERSDQLLTIIGALGGEWAKYSGKILSLQKQHKTLSNTLEELAGPRLNKLELQFKRVADLTTEDEPAMLVLPGGAESEES